MPSVRAEILQTLARRIDEIQSGARRRSARSPIPSGIPGLDELLPEKRLPAGSLVELLCDTPGAGTWSLALLMARQACGTEKGTRALVVADLERSFYPPAATKLGIDLTRTIVVRPRTWQDAYAAIDQSLRCPAVGAVVGGCDRLGTVDFRRLQLAAEEGGGVGLLLRPAVRLRQPSFATLRLHVKPVGTTEAARRIEVEVVRCRGGKDGGRLLLEIDEETGMVRVPKPAARRVTAITG
jgi:protein ImuA